MKEDENLMKQSIVCTYYQKKLVNNLFDYIFTATPIDKLTPTERKSFDEWKWMSSKEQTAGKNREIVILRLTGKEATNNWKFSRVTRSNAFTSHCQTVRWYRKHISRDVSARAHNNTAIFPNNNDDRINDRREI